MQGAALAAERQHDLAMMIAWHAAGFTNGGMKNRKLTDFQIGHRKTERSAAADAVAFFRNMKEAGFPVEIKRVVH
jgi:ketopantoate reductase